MTKTSPQTLTRFTTITSGVLLASLPFYAFLTVWGSSLVGHYTLLRLYPDIILLITMVASVVLLIRNEVLRQHVCGSLLFRVVSAYAALVGALGVVAYLKHQVTLPALAYGLLLDLRFLAWLFVVWVIVGSVPRASWLQRYWRRLLLWPLAAVAGFALLQFFVLPADFLSHFGYHKDVTIPAYQTINQNTTTIRAQSFLRGPNPLGAYLVLGIGAVAALYRFVGRKLWLQLLLAVSSVALVVTFSRSAWLGTAATIAVLAGLSLRTRRAQVVGLCVGGALLLAAGLGFWALRHNHGVQNAVLHVSQDSTATQTSNAGHAAAFKSGVHDIIRQPFGDGPGTAGPASVHNGVLGSRNSESYFLQIGQELGWAGLVLFVAITVVVSLELWQRRQQPLALGLFATLVGLTVVNQLSYAWADVTVAYVWWGLAGVALASPPDTKAAGGNEQAEAVQ